MPSLTTKFKMSLYVSKHTESTKSQNKFLAYIDDSSAMKKELISVADLEYRKQANTVKLQMRGGRCLSRHYLGRKGCMATSCNMIPIMSVKMRAGDRKGCLPSAVAILQFRNPTHVRK